MAKHIHVHIHRAPTRDRAPVARAVRSIGRDQHAPEDVSQLVGVLMQIIAEQGGKTQDAEFDESKHKRDEGGKFTAGGMNAEQHQAAAAAKRQKGEEALKASDTQSAVKHITESQAHEDVSRALGAADMSSASPGGDYKQHLKQAASHFARTAEAAKAMKGKSSLRGVDLPSTDLGEWKSSAEKMGFVVRTAPNPETGESGDYWYAKDKHGNHTGEFFAEAHANHAAQHKAEAAKIDEAHAITVHESRSGSASAPSKPTSTTAKHIKPALHELFSSGHPFSVDELCKITGVTNPKLMSAYVTDMKNPKYAGKLGALEIVKRPDGMYHVQKKEGAGLAPKPGPDGQPMGKHPELAAAERRVAENPRTTEVRHASGTGQSFLPSVKTSGAGAPPAEPQGSASGVPGWNAKKAAALKKNMETLRGRYEVAREKRKARGEHTQSLVEMKARSAYERADREHTSYSFPSKATSGK